MVWHPTGGFLDQLPPYVGLGRFGHLLGISYKEEVVGSSPNAFTQSFPSCRVYTNLIEINRHRPLFLSPLERTGNRTTSPSFQCGPGATRVQKPRHSTETTPLTENSIPIYGIPQKAKHHI